jgi:hypothetical protein
MKENMIESGHVPVSHTITRNNSRKSGNKLPKKNSHNRIEIDSILTDPSIRDSLRSDGYYKRHKQKAKRKDSGKNKARIGFKNVPLSFMKSLNTPAHSILRTGSPASSKDTASMRLKTHIKRRTK